MSLLYKATLDKFIMLLLGGIKMKTEKEYGISHKIIQKTLDIPQEQWKSYKVHGDIYYEEKNYHMAIECYEKALEKTEKKDSEILASIGECYFELNNSNKAKEFLEKAVDYDPMCFKANKILQYIYLRNSEYRKAIELCNTENFIDRGRKLKGPMLMI
jgi:tetratricopeptide (TPR) repeat protein